MTIFSNFVSAHVINEKEFISSGFIDYIYRTNKDDVFRCKNADCDLIFNISNDYCNDLPLLEDDLEADIRMKWICPKIYAFNHLYKEYGIKLTDDPAFSDYILNLYRIMDNGKYSTSDKIIRIDDFSLQVGMSPDAFFIPSDINDVIKSIVIKTNNSRFVTEEYYLMNNGDEILRYYKYNDIKIKEIITRKINNGKEIYSLRSIFKYD